MPNLTNPRIRIVAVHAAKPALLAVDGSVISEPTRAKVVIEADFGNYKKRVPIYFYDTALVEMVNEQDPDKLIAAVKMLMQIDRPRIDEWIANAHVYHTDITLDQGDFDVSARVAVTDSDEKLSAPPPVPISVPYTEWVVRVVKLPDGRYAHQYTKV